VPLLLDAYNILHCTHKLPGPYALLTAPQLGQLLDRIAYHPGPIYVVCDGSPKPDEAQNLDMGRSRLVYAGPRPRTADDVIEDLVERTTDRRNTTVVSNDRHVQRVARHRGCTVVSADDFVRDLTRSIHSASAANRSAADIARQGPEKPLQADVRDWLKQFGYIKDTPPPSQAQLEAEADQYMREFGFTPDDEDD
jgi:predicted RNA-binding protein with PIN domain